MEKDHVITEEVMKSIQAALANQEHWLAYNTASYFLEKEDVYFFSRSDEAEEFSRNNISEHDCFKAIKILSIDDAIRQIPYGKMLDNYLRTNTTQSLVNSKAKTTLKNLQQSVNKHLITSKTFFMNEKNLEYLKENLKYTGFSDKLNFELEKNMQQGLPEFQLHTQAEFNKDKVDAVLHFKKSDTSEMYFFNKYDATLEKSKEEKLSNTFYLNKGNGVTLKEAYNLLNGRAVNKDLINKEGQKYNAWIQLDVQNKDNNGNYKMKQFHENYGYDLESTLKQYPIKELTDAESKEMLLHSLQKGNVQSVTFEMDGSTSKMFLEANPQYKTINLYDGQMKPVQKEVLEQYQSAQQLQDKDVKQDVKEDTKDKSQDKKQEINESKKNSKSVKPVKQNSLLPKKRTTHKKGLSLS
jgi:hypothetical protein